MAIYLAGNRRNIIPLRTGCQSIPPNNSYGPGWSAFSWTVHHDVWRIETSRWFCCQSKTGTRWNMLKHVESLYRKCPVAVRWLMEPSCLVMIKCSGHFQSEVRKSSRSASFGVVQHFGAKLFGYGSIPINTIFRGMNIHLPAILMFTRGTRFWHTAI